MTTATRTVLFTDVADYTAQVSRTDREGLRRLLGPEGDAEVRAALGVKASREYEWADLADRAARVLFGESLPSDLPEVLDREPAEVKGQSEVGRGR